jgi:hypothetical protein
VRVLRNTNGELLRDRLDALLSVAGSSWVETARMGILSFLEEDLPRSLSELASLEGKRERASIIDLTDILFLRDEAGDGDSCCGGVSVHMDDLRGREKKSEMLLMLAGLGPCIAHDRRFTPGAGSAQTVMEEEEPSPALLPWLFISPASPMISK